jgi:hypothetical protein
MIAKYSKLKGCSSYSVLIFNTDGACYTLYSKYVVNLLDLGLFEVTLQDSEHRI